MLGQEGSGKFRHFRSSQKNLKISRFTSGTLPSNRAPVTPSETRRESELLAKMFMKLRSRCRTRPRRHSRNSHRRFPSTPYSRYTRGIRVDESVILCSFRARQKILCLSYVHLLHRTRICTANRPLPFQGESLQSFQMHTHSVRFDQHAPLSDDSGRERGGGRWGGGRF